MRSPLCAAALLLTPAIAAADFTPVVRQPDFSAFTLRQGELRLGLFQEEYGLLDAWMVGTYLPPWILIPITKSPVLNLYTKVKLIDVGPERGDRFALSARANFFWADIDDFQISGVEDGRFKATVLPFIIDGSYVFDEVWTATLEATFVQTWLNGQVESSGDGEFAGVGAQQNFQLALIGEARLGRHVALNLVVRYAPWVQALRVRSELEVDAQTSTIIDAALDASTSGTAWLVQPGVTFSWGVFNLQLGVGYGNLFLPGIRMISGLQTVVPDFDLYFRF